MGPLAVTDSAAADAFKQIDCNEVDGCPVIVRSVTVIAPDTALVLVHVPPAPVTIT